MSTRRIAELAGVSPTTVSLALRNNPKIPAATRQRVQKLAQKLGYRPDAKVTELMAQLRLKRDPGREACLGVISFYDTARPWENALHLQRIYKGMTDRAEALGYRLEPLWLKAPGMTCARFRRILDARGIQGLLCFGSPNLEEEMPPEFDHYAIVTQGVSIKTPLHRVASHAYNDMWRMMKKVRDLGYRRPGLVIGDYEGQRSAHAYLCVYLGWHHLMNGAPPPIPILRLVDVEEAPLLGWLRSHRPDVIIFAHHYKALPALADVLRRHKIRTPADVGVAAVTQVVEGTDFSGLQGNQHLVGTCAVDMVVSRIVTNDFGLPAHPRIEMVEMEWMDGKTLNQQPAAST
jgi:DNA-binding LacI/PurR family transcriptional regulator